MENTRKQTENNREQKSRRGTNGKHTDSDNTRKTIGKQSETNGKPIENTQKNKQKTIGKHSENNQKQTGETIGKNTRTTLGT